MLGIPRRKRKHKRPRIVQRCGSHYIKPLQVRCPSIATAQRNTRALELGLTGSDRGRGVCYEGIPVARKQVLLNPAELEQWQADPEAWTIGKVQKQAEFMLEIRPAAERLLTILANKAKPKYFVGR